MNKGKIMCKEEAAYHVIHKLPPGDSPYVRAKHLQVYIYIYMSNIIYYICILRVTRAYSNIV